MKILSCAIAASALASCSSAAPPADEANNAAVVGNVDVDVLPPDESVATPDSELANGAQNVDGAANEAEADILTNVTP